MLLAAARARLSSAVPRRLMDAAGAGGSCGVSTTQRFTPPRSLQLALAFEVGKMEGNLPGSPHAVDGRYTLPIIHLTWEMLGCEDRRKGHHHEFDISSGHAGLFCLFFAHPPS